MAGQSILLDVGRVDPEAFAYPVYVTFLLAPLLPLPFEKAQIIFTVILVVLTVTTLPLWIRGLRLRVGMPAKLLGFAALMSSYSVVEDSGWDRSRCSSASLWRPRWRP